VFGEGQLGLEIAEMLSNTEQSAACLGELISSVRFNVAMLVMVESGLLWVVTECLRVSISDVLK
jgi:hypothetical protein